MPTENPKVSAYVPKVLKDRLTEFKQERGISESQAVIIILAEYFELEQDIASSNTQVGGVSLARVENIEIRTKTLETQFSELQNFVHEHFTLASENISEPQVESDSEFTQSEPEDHLYFQGRHQLELSPVPVASVKPVSGRRLGLSRFRSSIGSVADAKRKKSTEELTEWTKQKDPDDIPWKYVESPSKGYLPDVDIDSLPSEKRSRLLKWIDEHT